MKVVLGTDSLQPPLTGIGRYTFELARGLLSSPSIDEVVGYDLGRVHSLADRVAELASFAGEDRSGSALRQWAAGSRVLTASYRYYVRLLSGYLLRRHADAVFHSPNFYLPRHIGPSVVTVHDLSYLLFPDYHPAARVAWMTDMVPRALQASAHIICVSESTQTDLLREYGVDRAKTSVIPLGVDPRYRPRVAAAVAPVLAARGLGYRQYFLCVATLEPRKNIDALLDAYLGLPRSSREKFPLVLVGSPGWHSQALTQRLRSLAAGEGCVAYLGYVPEAELAALYSGALCFVYPSHYEGFGLPILEAQSSGVPVITSGVSSIPEVANEHCLMLTPGDMDALREGLARSLDDAGWRESCSEAGLRYAREFTWQRCLQQTVEVYRHVCT